MIFKIRYLASNYWNCPIPDYSSPSIDDFTTAKGECGKRKF